MEMTNGEKLHIDFPNLRITMLNDCVIVMGENYEFNNAYPLDWWNAEYKESTTKKIMEVPTADVQPVIHAKWIFRSGAVYDEYICSNCNKRHTDYATNYCPNCGAKMDKEIINGSN